MFIIIIYIIFKHASLFMVAYSLQVIVRMQQYKDDLLSSCLQMVLTLPEEMVLLELDSLIPAIEVEYMYYYMYKYCNY